jgi:hypothetical protein
MIHHDTVHVLLYDTNHFPIGWRSGETIQPGAREFPNRTAFQRNFTARRACSFANFTNVHRTDVQYRSGQYRTADSTVQTYSTGQRTVPDSAQYWTVPDRNRILPAKMLAFALQYTGSRGVITGMDSPR